MIGTELIAFLRAAGHDVYRFVRKPTDKPNEIYLHPEYGISDASVLEKFDTVINLAGESVAGKRWTEMQKGRIYESRIRTTTHLVQAFERLEKPPELLISASAIGFYGENSHRALTETRLWIVPHIPNPIFNIGSFVLSHRKIRRRTQSRANRYKNRPRFC